VNHQNVRIVKGTYSARVSTDARDIRAAQRFRAARFVAGDDGLDRDRFDHLCRHVLIEDLQSGDLVACFRFQHLDSGAGIGRTYAAQYYDLSRLVAYEQPLLEIGRFCVHPDLNDPEILRMLWALLTRYVDAHKIGLLFGCSSFEGAIFEPHRQAFALLKHRYLAPAARAPGVKSPETIAFGQDVSLTMPGLKEANQAMPPLLRSYLAMGGWVSDHAVVDRRLNTLHVFTGVEIDLIPPARKRLLRADAGQA